MARPQWVVLLLFPLWEGGENPVEAYRDFSKPARDPSESGSVC